MNKFKEKINYKIIDCILSNFLIFFCICFLYLKYETSYKMILVGILTLIVNNYRIFYYNKFKEIINKIIDKRYIVALLLFIFCLIFKLHGSSIDMYNSFIDTTNEDATSIIIGKAREIRSDEWAVHTPYYFSQKFNDYQKKNSNISYDGQNMILGYNAPVFDITLIGKPFTWGYMLFGNEIGLSWYWCSKLILFVLVSFELCLILTKGNRRVSIIGTLLISFAPPMQWWYVPHMTDAVFWAITILVMAYKFFTINSKRLKILFTILLPCSLIGFALALFPSFQVPLGLISFALFIGLLIRDKEKITFSKKEFYRLIFVFVCFIGVLGYFAISSFDDIKLLLNTVYPGSRISTGGNYNLKDLFTNLTTVFLPYKDINESNNCEISSFIQFAPFFLILWPKISPYLKSKGKKLDLLIGKILLFILIIEIIFMLLGFTEFISKITLFSYINRMHLIYGYTAVLFNIWCINIIWENRIEFDKYLIIVSLILLGLLNVTFLSDINLNYLSKWIYILEIIYFMFICYSIIKFNKKISTFLIFLLIVMASFTINPIASGIKPITNHKVSKIINSEISKNKKSVWMATDSFVLANYLVANGAKVANATNFYPDYKKWDLIDKNKNNDFYYNRYINMKFIVTNNETKFELLSADCIQLYINIDDIKNLNIKYILTKENLSEILDVEDIEYSIIYDSDNDKIKIYKLSY